MSLSIVQRARTTFERISGLHVYRGLPHGTNIASDLKRVFPNHVANTVFDVGANVGQSALKFSRYFPHAQILCFEPVSNTYEQLTQTAAALPNVRTFKLALSDTNGSQSMVLTGLSLTFHLVRENEVPDVSTIETVQVQRLDDFCSAQQISAINYLKIDAEGFDLNVLRGGEKLIGAGGVDFIQVEAGMNPGYPGHVPFGELYGWLTSRGFELFGIYDQCPTWPKGQIMRRADPVFVSSRLVNAR